MFHLLKNQPSLELGEGRGGYGFDTLSLRLFMLKADETHPNDSTTLYRFLFTINFGIYPVFTLFLIAHILLLISQVDEAKIISQAQKGNLSAFNKLVMAYQGRAYNVAYRVTGNEDAAADACQDAFLKAYNAIKQYHGGSFKSWLLRIVTNTCYDHIRYKSRRPASSLEDIVENPAEHAAQLTSPAESPEEHTLRGELGDVIQGGINQLSDDQRIVLVLSDIEGYSYQEIAKIIDQPLGTVKSRLSRARRRLKEFLVTQKELLPSQYRLKYEQ